MPSQALLSDQTREYLQAHPKVAEQLRNAEKVYSTFWQYLTLTQSRVIIRESGAFTAEAEFGATLLRTDF